MWLVIIVLVAAAEISATTPPRPPLKCPIPTGPYVPPNCGENAYFELCSYPCPPQNCSTLWTKYKKCPETCCKPECRCNDGFLRDDVTGRCIRRDECFSPCGLFEHYVIGSTECQKTCANYKVTGPESMCKPFTGCVCNKGRVRINDDGSGVCIHPDFCPPRQCPIFEHWDDCPSVCLPETCISKSPDYKCLLPAIPLPCKPRCICDKGFLRDEYGNCIPESHCNIQSCPINEEWRCSSMCARDSCARLLSGFECPPEVPSSICIPACECKSGFLRNDEGDCVPEELCPKSPRCGGNEIAVPNATICPPQTCESIYSLYRCVDNVESKPGCDCRNGYLRNKLGICVPSDYCPGPPQICGPNQEYNECGTSCGNRCSDLDGSSCEIDCVAGCFCKVGYFMDEEGNCVTSDECPLPICNQPNEVAKACGSPCEARTCDDYKRTDISCAAVCVRGCFCLDGYVRNAYGVCVLPEECPPEPVCLQENEEYQSCGSSCPDNCDNYLDTSRICTMQCVAGCNCKPGYVRRLEDKRCVLPEECPSKECTGLNEALNYCASYCPVTCANRFTQGDWSCATVCRIGCDCIPGTLRNDTGVCVPTEECTPPVCRQNEKYLKCGTACPLTCENMNNPPQACTRQCVEDCFCEEGYVRDRNWRCVKPCDCEPICPPGEKFDVCSAHCEDTCDNYGNPNRVCTLQCQSGCVCEAGTVRAPDGRCVKPEECKPKCPAGETYNVCSAHCQDTCENYKDPNRICTYQCQSGCVCNKGTVRAPDGQCVIPEECPLNKPCSDPNAIRKKCAAHESCRPTCAQPQPRICPRICIIDGCECKPGYVLSEKGGKCILPEECPQDGSCNGDPNAEIVSNPRPCPSTCEVPDGQPGCKRRGLPVGCECKSGYLLSEDNGKCILPEECKGGDPCGVNSTYVACKVNCPNDFCPVNDDRGIIACDPPYPCYGGCVCRLNYRRLSNKEDKCILASQCPPVTCTRPNEVWSPCPSPCLSENCEDRNKQPVTCRTLLLNCQPQCICRKGHFRNEQGICVPASQCPPLKQCPPNERWIDCEAGYCAPKTCGELGYPIACPGIIGPCPGGCICNENEVRNSLGICIPEKECPSCGGDFNATTGCGINCGRLCSNYDKNVDCNIPLFCQFNACDCKDGYVYDEVRERCVLSCDCPVPCNGDIYAEWVKCPNPCPKTCAKPNPGVCNKMCLKGGCQCRQGFILDPNGKCVKVENCPDNLGCNGDPNAIIRNCPNPCPETCKLRGPRPCPAICLETGCECKYGFVLSDEGKCIKPEQCNVTTVITKTTSSSKSNQQSSSRNSDSSSQTETDGQSTKTSLENREWSSSESSSTSKDSSSVKKTTRVKRTSDTVPPGNSSDNEDSKRLILCPMNEVWIDCKAEYCKPQYCRDQNKKLKTKQVTNPCPGGCICKPGYLRNDDDLCIPIKQCPPQCPRNERWTDCLLGFCAPKTCDDLGYPIACPDIIGPCAGGCVCDGGLVRNRKGICIPSENCPSCGGDFNATVGCGTNCGKLCTDYNKPVNCTGRIGCQYNGCDCRDGYFYDVVTEKCVSPCDCPVPCKGDVFAELTTCPNPCPPTCANPNPGPCKKLCVKKGCQCRQGYILAPNGKCVKPEQCPVDLGCNGDPNAIVKVCPNPCPDTCEKRGPRPCPAMCLAIGCECKEGFVRSKEGKCISPDECDADKPCSDPNAIRKKCASHEQCRATCAVPNSKICPKICIINGCECKPGYVLSEKGGKCIIPEQCPSNTSCNGDPNAEIRSSPRACPSTCEIPNGIPGCLKLGLDVGCECKSGYLLSDDNGKCILPGDCKGGDPCGRNATYTACKVTNCPNFNCPINDNRGLVPCPPPPMPCYGGCSCIFNHLHISTDDDRCIFAADCPPVKCTRPNEVWSSCPSACLRENCEDIDNQPTTCETLILNCQPRCICKKGHFRNDKGICIPAKKCPKPVCGPNEHYEWNSSKCEGTCSTVDEKYQGPCEKTSKCFCDDGYVRNKRGVCVKKEECPKPIICPVNEVLSECYTPCSDRTCKNRIRGDGRMCHTACIESGCVCIPNYFRHDNGTCVPVDQCPPPRCNKNETYSNCGTACPETCQNRGETCIACTDNCVEDCFCSPGFVRSDDGSCIKPDDCPVRTCSGVNEEFVVCPPTCPPSDNCTNLWTDYDCSNTVVCCKPKCRCKSGYLRNDDGVCIIEKRCYGLDPPCSDPNAERIECAPPTECRPTCLEPNPVCTLACVKNSCRCKKGYVLSEKNGKCIKPDQCKIQKSCNGDPNAVVEECPISCPATCQAPNAGPCRKACEPVGCACKDGYILSESNGICIQPERCEGGNPCGRNETFASCKVGSCPNNYCSGRAICETPSPCYAGCICKKGYKRLSKQDERCILATECPNGDGVTSPDDLNP